MHLNFGDLRLGSVYDESQSCTFTKLGLVAEIRLSPVGSLSVYPAFFSGFYISQVVVWDF